MIIYIIFLIKLKLYVLAWINWYLILATHFRKLIFIKLEFNSGIKDQPMFFLFRQKEPIRPAGGPPLRLFVRQCDHARLAQKWSAIELPTFLHWRADGITLLFGQISEAGLKICLHKLRQILRMSQCLCRFESLTRHNISKFANKTNQRPQVAEQQNTR